MKKIATFALLAAASAAACAQSNATVFGVLDLGLRDVKNGSQSVKSVSVGGLTSNRLGFRGAEDLGGGLKAEFWIETGFNPDTGANADAARFWNRRSTLSLTSSSFGELRLGRDYTPTYGGYSNFDTFNSNGVAAVDKFFPSTLGSGNPSIDTGTRADNQVSYLTPNTLGGFYAKLSVAPGEAVAGKRYRGGRVGYAAGPLDVSGAYGETQVTLTSGVDKFQVYDFGVSYDFGVAKALAIYGESKFGSLKLDVLEIGALVPVGAGTVRVSYVHANAKGGTTDADDASQFAVGYVHNLSKRTALYTTYARVNNKGAAKFNVGTPPAAGAGLDSTGYELGLRHSF